ncbi:MAG: hypothetical protein WCT19_02010 [Candidatus Paceibacterota bacterium]
MKTGEEIVIRSSINTALVACFIVGMVIGTIVFWAMLSVVPPKRGQSQAANAKKEARDKQQTDTAATTMGNYSHIPLNLMGHPSDEINRLTVLQSLNSFESEMRVEITFFQIDYTPIAVHGIWVQHRPKTTNTGPAVLEIK